MVVGYSKALDDLLNYAELLDATWINRPDGTRVDGSLMADILIRKGDALYCSEDFVRLITAAAESFPSGAALVNVADFISDAGSVTFAAPIEVSMVVPLVRDGEVGEESRHEEWFGFTWFCGLMRGSKEFVAEVFPYLKREIDPSRDEVRSYFVFALTNYKESSSYIPRLLKALWVLARQKNIAEVTSVTPDRHARKRAEKHHAKSVVSVIQLPKRVREYAGGARSVEWQSRWIVRGHWRQQPWGPERSQVRPVWIAPYIKGPEDKPLVAPARRLFVAGGLDG